MSQERTQEQEGSALSPLHPTTVDSLRSELLRAGVERMLAQALEVEAELHISRHRDDRDAAGKRQVVRNGYLPVRGIRCGVGPVRIRQPRVHDARTDAHGRRHRFASTVLPAYARTTTCIGRPAEDQFFHGLATGDMTLAFEGTFGSIIAELPQSFLPRLRELWEADRERLTQRAFHGCDFAQLWADSIPVPSDAGEPGLCTLLFAATMPDGVDVLGVSHGRPEDEQSWTELLSGLVLRGLVVRAERLHASAPEAARAAVARQGRRQTG